MVHVSTEILFNTERLTQQMEAGDVDAVVATSIENVHYLTGVNSVALDMFPHTGHCFAVVTRDQPETPYFISSRCEVDQFLDAPWALSGAMAYGPFTRESSTEPLTHDEQRLKMVSVDDVTAATPLEALTRALKELGVADGRVAIDDTGVRPGFLDDFAGTRSTGSLLDAGPILRSARKVKTPGEQAAVAAAAAVAERGIAAAVGIAAPGSLSKTSFVNSNAPSPDWAPDPNSPSSRSAAPLSVGKPNPPACRCRAARRSGSTSVAW